MGVAATLPELSEWTLLAVWSLFGRCLILRNRNNNALRLANKLFYHLRQVEQEIW